MHTDRHFHLESAFEDAVCKTSIKMQVLRYSVTDGVNSSAGLGGWLWQIRCSYSLSGVHVMK